MDDNKNGNLMGENFEPEMTIAPRNLRRERTFNVGDVICGRYHLEEKLGAGAMGMVFRCRDENSGVEYAVKMVPPELARDEDAMESIRANFTLVHNLKHPGIAGADFLDKDLKTGDYYLIMEYVPGKNLSRWLAERRRDGGPDFAEVVRIAGAIAAALDYAHSQKITHRDIKPANIMITPEGQVKVLDFGLAAKVRSSMSNISMKIDNSSGTPSYMAPEQWKAQYPKPSVDQYALGVLTYEMLAGHLPFEAADNSILRDAVLNDVPEPVDGVSERVMNAIRRAMAKKHEDRFANCMEFAAALTSSSKIPVQNDTKKSDEGMLVFWISLLIIAPLPIIAQDVITGHPVSWDSPIFRVIGVMEIILAAASYICINWKKTRYNKLFWTLSLFYIFLYIFCFVCHGVDFIVEPSVNGIISSCFLILFGAIYFCYWKKHIDHPVPWLWRVKAVKQNGELQKTEGSTISFTSAIMLAVWTVITSYIWSQWTNLLLQRWYHDIWIHGSLEFAAIIWIITSFLMLIFFFKKSESNNKQYVFVTFIITMAAAILLILAERAFNIW
ncbi:MAG: serine/threonine-protein kinase [Victivallaceae bacterium]|nr:serine/threonine-protein kinase [Victivallaceae bacterium]